VVDVQVTVNAVFRVQCDGPCRGWLSPPDGYHYTLGTETRYAELVVRPEAERACTWTGERSARRAAQGSGWDVQPGRWLCPACKLNPLGIRLPPPGIERFEDTRSDDPIDWMPGDRGWTG